jgi:MFS family permease
MAIFERFQQMKELSVSMENKQSRIWPLYGAAFMMSLTLNSWWTSMPFIIDNIGGSKAHVGFAWAANMLGYLVCLLLAGLFLGSRNPRNTTRLAAAVRCISTAAVGLITWTILNCQMKGNLSLIWLIIAAGTIAGGATALFWPFLMSWVSEDLEGPVLNRRLGNYNSSWSSSLITGPLIGGILVQSSILLPAIFVTAGLIICFIFLNFSADSKFHAALFGDEDGKKTLSSLNRSSIMRMRWIARIALFCSWACIGVSRSQYALLFTEMGHSEAMFGVLITIFGACNFSALTLAGRYAFWHFKPAQLTLVISLLMIIFVKSLLLIILAFIILGCGFGFAYSSHLYYGTCGAKRRSVQMAIHEATISCGIIVGSGTGGYIAGKYGLYQPYWFMLSLVVAGLIAQTIIMPHSKVTN